MPVEPPLHLQQKGGRNIRMNEYLLFLFSSMHLLISLFKRCFGRRNRRRGRMLGLRLSISLSLEFYKKMATSEIKFEEYLMGSS